MKELFIALEVENVKGGEKYKTLPLHCTLIHWVLMPDNIKTKMVLSETLLTPDFLMPIALTAMNKEKFGPNNDVPAYTIKKIPALNKLHLYMADHLEKMNCHIKNEEWAYNGYSPHVKAENNILPIGVTYISKRIYLAERTNGYKIIRELIELNIKGSEQTKKGS